MRLSQIASIIAAFIVTVLLLALFIFNVINGDETTFKTVPSTTKSRSTTTTTTYSTPTTTRRTTSSTTTAPTTSTPSTTSSSTSSPTRTPTTSLLPAQTTEYTVLAVTPMSCSSTPVPVYADGAQQNMGLYGSPRLTTTVNGALLTFAAKPQGFTFSKLILAREAGNMYSGDGADFSSANIVGPTNIRIASNYTPYAVTMC